MYKLYFAVAGMLVSVVAMFGFILPMTISAASTPTVLIGVALGLSYIPLFVWCGAKLVKSFKRKLIENEKN